MVLTQTYIRKRPKTIVVWFSRPHVKTSPIINNAVYKRKNKMNARTTSFGMSFFCEMYKWIILNKASPQENSPVESNCKRITHRVRHCKSRERSLSSACSSTQSACNGHTSRPYTSWSNSYSSLLRTTIH